MSFPSLARDHDEASTIMRRWGLYRCHAVDTGLLSTELSRALADAPAPPPEPGPVISDLRDRGHDVQLDRLADAAALATAAEQTHRRDDQWPHGLADHLADMFEAVEAHQQREDAIVFPLLLDDPDAAPGDLLDCMAADHVALAHHLDELAGMTRNFTCPPQACPAWRVLYWLVRKLDEDLRGQMALEDEVLFRTRLRKDTEGKGCLETMSCPEANSRTSS